MSVIGKHIDSYVNNNSALCFISACFIMGLTINSYIKGKNGRVSALIDL